MRDQGLGEHRLRQGDLDMLNPLELLDGGAVKRRQAQVGKSLVEPFVEDFLSLILMIDHGRSMPHRLDCVDPLSSQCLDATRFLS